MTTDQSQAVPPADGVMSDEQRAESKEYGRRQLHCTLATMVLDLAYLAVLALLLAQPLDEWLAGLGVANDWLRLCAFFTVVTLAQLALSFPWAVYSGFVLEHKYQLSRQSLRRWLARYLLQHALAFGLGLFLVAGLFLVIRLTGPYWWLVAAGASFLVSVVIGQLAPVLILPLFYKVERCSSDELASRFQRIASGTGLNIEGVYRLRLSTETVKANAMLAGLGHTRRVILGDTLLDGFTADEIEVVFAHEVGHHVYRHLTKLLLAGVVVSLASFLLCDLALRQWVGAGQERFSYESLPIYSLAMILLIVTLFSMLLAPVQNAISRHFERQCDRFALRRTGMRDAYLSAFTKLARLNKADPDPHPLEVFLFHDHPAIAERLAMADQPTR